MKTKQLFSIFALVLSSATLAQLPNGITPQMIGEFQQMSRAQQEVIADQFGIDMEQLDQLMASPSQSQGSIGRVERLEPQQLGNRNEDTSDREESDSESDEEASIEQTAESQIFMKPLPLFGTDIFDNEISTFISVDNAPIPSEYTLGPGDSVAVQLYGNENQTLNLTVDREGVINFPELGPIAVAGMSFANVRELLQNRIAEEMIGVRAAFSLGRLRAINIFMAGEAANPGSYAVSALTTVTQALFSSGGISEIGSLRNIQIRRANQIVGTFDLYDLLLRGDASSDIRLQSGDVVFIPTVGAVAQIDGAVRRPAAFELKPDESLADLLTMAGGFYSNSYRSDILYRTYAEGGLQKLSSVNLNRIDPADLTLRDGDGFLVSEATSYIQERVTVRGAVTRSGPRGWQPGMRVSDVFSSVVDDLKASDVDLNYAIVVRVKNAERDIEVVQFNLGQAIREPGSSADIELNAEDELIVFDLPSVSGGDEVDEDEGDDLTDFESYLRAQNQMTLEPGDTSSNRQQLLEPILEKLRLQADRQEPVRIATINGNVKVPGSYPLTTDMTVAQLIQAAGGLQDSAVEDAELLRLSEIPGGQVEVEQIALDLNPVTALSSQSGYGTLLHSRDTVLIRTISDWNLNEQVLLSGQVRFPGTYTIVPGEKLSSLIRRAGGLKDSAFVEGAIFTRESLAEREATQAQEFARSIRDTFAARTMTQEVLSSTFEDIDEVASYFEEYEGIGRMVIDLEQVVVGDPAADLELLPGDQLFLPRRPDSVTVVGAVFHEGSHRYNPILTVQDYLELSGGVDQRALERGIYVLKADGSVFVPSRSAGLFRFSSVENRIGPGDTVIVPVDTAFKDRWTLIKDITQIAYQAGVGLAAVLAAF